MCKSRDGFDDLFAGMTAEDFLQENDGDSSCKHEWKDDGDNMQIYCKKCTARRYNTFISDVERVK